MSPLTLICMHTAGTSWCPLIGGFFLRSDPIVNINMDWFYEFWPGEGLRDRKTVNKVTDSLLDVSTSFCPQTQNLATAEKRP